MTDRFSKEKRSEIMSHIGAKDTKPETLLRSALHRRGYRFRKNDRRLPGTPDIYLPKYKTVIFVHGCFWHGHQGCKHFRIPKTNTTFWAEKFEKNRARDKRKAIQLSDAGYNVIILWECEIIRNVELCIDEKILPHLIERQNN